MPLLKNKLRSFREAKQIPQWQLSEETGVNCSRICIVEQGGRPRPREVEVFCEFFGVTPGEIWPGAEFPWLIDAQDGNSEAIA